jgi:alpha-beta hydrolase superfamily lysophospholipase
MAIHLRLFLTVISAIVFSFSAAAQCKESICQDGTQASGAKYRICMPEASCYRGELAVYAHGYQSEFEPVGIPENQVTLPDGTSIPGLINALGFGFVMSSYSKTGLAVLEGIADTADAVEVFKSVVGTPSRIYLAGVSEGGLITAKAIEETPSLYSGGLSTCGPIGDFPFQINYYGDWRVLFDYFFPGVLPPSPLSIPQSVIDNWDAVYRPAIEAAVAADPAAAAKVLAAGNIPGATPEQIQQSFRSLGWYNVFATNNGIQVLGGNPFDNSSKVYLGSGVPFALNLGVERFSPDPAAVAEMQANYQTTGQLTIPLVTLHTTGDEIIPYRHQLLYRQKVNAAGAGALHLNIPALSYGHCNFTTGQALASFLLLVLKVSGQDLSATAEPLLRTDNDRREFRALFRANRAWAARP